jgi:hypothetical protein
VVTLVSHGLGPRWLFELQLWTVSQGASVWLVDLAPYESCRVAGLVERLRIDPVAGFIEASISDGTASVLAQWSIGRPTPQLAVAPGRAVVLEGVAGIGPDGELVLVNPTFETVPFPEVA